MLMPPAAIYWRYQHDLPETYIAFHRTNRGVALYGDKVYTATLDARVVALDASTGRKVWDSTVQDNNFGYYITMAPLAIDGKILVGTSGGELGIRGSSWHWTVKPRRSPAIYNISALANRESTWPVSLCDRAAVLVPVTMTRAGLAYFAPAIQLWIEIETRTISHTNSVLPCYQTGKIQHIRWNGSWDWDEVSTPIPMPVERQGRMIDALVHPGRNGSWTSKVCRRYQLADAEPYVYQNACLDPETGRPTYDPKHKPTTGSTTSFCPSLWGGKDWPAAYNPDSGLLHTGQR